MTKTLTQASIAAPNQTKTMKQNKLKESENCVKKMNCLKLSYHALDGA